MSKSYFGALLNVKGNWAHFKKPETSNNPLTHDLIPKTALIGLMGAVLGIERETMKGFFPQLSEDIGYGVALRSNVRKVSWGFTMRTKIDIQYEKAPKQMELLKNPDFLVAVALLDERSLDLFQHFLEYVEAQKACYTPILGLHNCPAEIGLVAKGSFVNQEGVFQTSGFVPTKGYDIKPALSNLNSFFRIGFEKLPTFQNDDFWNLPDKYLEVIYPEIKPSAKDAKLEVIGTYYQFDDQSQWTLI